MKNYIEQCLRQDIIVIENKTIYNNLPLKYKGLYSIYDVSTKQIEWIILKPNINIMQGSMVVKEKIAIVYNLLFIHVPTRRDIIKKDYPYK